MMMSRSFHSPYVKLPSFLLWLFGGGACFGVLTANPLLTVASVLVVPLFMILLWRQGEPPILLFAVMFQWLQVTAKVFQADFTGVSVETLSIAPQVGKVVGLSLAGLVVLALGMRLGVSRLRIGTEPADELLSHFSLDRIFLLALVTSLAGQVLQRFAWFLPDVTQIILALLEVKWVFFFMLGYLVFQRKEKYHYFALPFLIEFIGGIGFFSGFKTVIFVTLIILFTIRFQFKTRTILRAGVIVSALVVLGLVWTSVKGEYREFLNQGTGQQVIRVSRTDRLMKIVDLVGELRVDDLLNATEPLFERVAYVDYFTAAMDYVPAYVPHTRGGLWEQSILHVLRPRLFFPDKPVLPSDSELTMRYTGLRLASGRQGTSISLGYMAESYIDFGRYGMFVPILVIGLLWGFMYYYFVSKSQIPLIGYGFATSLLIDAYQFDMAGIKLLGGVLMKFLVLALFFHFVMPHVSDWLQGTRNRTVFSARQAHVK